MKSNPILLIIFSLLLNACTNSINLPLNHVKTADGYMNSSTLDFGHVLIWDTKSNNVSNIYKVTQPTVASSDVDIDEGPKFKHKESSLSRDTKFDVSGNVSQKIKGQAEAEFIKSTQIVLDDFNPKQFRTPVYALNCAALKTWRQSLPAEYSGDQYRFVFISRVTNATNISISKKYSKNSQLGADVIKVGSYKFNVSYDNKNQTSIQSDGQSPMIVEPTVYKFDNSGDNLRFSQDLNTIYKF
jgi:hypothetical protein